MAATATSAPGGFIGRYTLDAPLGEGAIGKVYLGIDKYTGASIAIQFVHPNLLPTRQLFKTLQQHVRNVSWLWHMFVARVYYLRQVQLFTFLIEAYAGPQNLQDKVEADGPMPPHLALYRASQVAEALSAAHGKQIFHLHLKPSGVVLTDDDACRLTGFGTTPFYDRSSDLYCEKLSAQSPNLAGRAADIQALGSLTAYLLTGQEGLTAPPEGDYEGKDLIAPLLSKLLDDECETSFPDTEEVSQAFLTVLEQLLGKASPSVDAIPVVAAETSTPPTDPSGPQCPPASGPEPTNASLPPLPDDDIPPPGPPPGVLPPDASPDSDAIDLVARLQERERDRLTPEIPSALEPTPPPRRSRVFRLLLALLIASLAGGIAYRLAPPTVQASVRDVIEKVLQRLPGVTARSRLPTPPPSPMPSGGIP